MNNYLAPDSRQGSHSMGHPSQTTGSQTQSGGQETAFANHLELLVFSELGPP